MKILFICGSMEPGRDGVGDYTRLLAAELKLRGHSVSIIALRDKFIHDSFIGIQKQSGVSLEVLRCTITDKLKTRASAALKYAKSFNPEWISLQFVPYAFSTHGVPIGLGAVIRSLNQEANIHMMIHESYLTGKLNMKNQLVRYGQILGLKNLMKGLNPKVIHTSIPSYQELLKNIGVESDKLGLFGNLPIVKCNSEQNQTESLRAVYFGIGPLERNFSQFSDGIREFIHETERQFELSFCGNIGEIGELFVRFLESQKIGGLEIKVLGRMESSDLSKLFFDSDIGVARVEPDLLGKSGTAIAMLEHGLPLWVPLAISQNQIEENFDFRIELCFNKLSQMPRKKETLSRLTEVANELEKKLISVSVEPAKQIGI